MSGSAQSAPRLPWPEGEELCVVVDLDADHDAGLDVDLDAERRVPAGTAVVVGTSRRSQPVVPDAVDVVLVEGAESDTAADVVVVPRLDEAVDALRMAVAAAPRAAVALVRLLRQTEALAVPAALAAESAVYSMLLAGPEFARWRANRPVRPVPAVTKAVLLHRDDARLLVTLNRPERRNAFGVAVRDGLVTAFDLVLSDPSIRSVEVRGAGPAFCSGGDLDEFGSTPDVATAHLIRLDRSVGARLHACRDRVTVFVHGACVGAGMEIPAFASRVVAAPGTTFRLPELRMGLVPGAGGTVSLVRRVGRRRVGYLALSGASLDTARALRWGLIDALGT